ncbi:MAG: type II toxin-antitoxin system VapC family toxin [Thermoguttaceae bacterium]
MVDTNVLLRVAEPHFAQHIAAVEAVARLISQNQEICLAPQVISEFWVVATRPTSVNGFGWSLETVELEIVRLLKQFPVLLETPQLFAEWHRLVVQYRVMGKQAHDARLVAIMNNCGLTHLLTFNLNNFRAYSVNVVSPDEVAAS